MRTRSVSTAPSATVLSYLSRACLNLTRHASRSAVRRGSPGACRWTALRINSSCPGASPKTFAQSSEWNARCVSGYDLLPSQMRSHLRHRSICAWRRVTLVP